MFPTGFPQALLVTSLILAPVIALFLLGRPSLRRAIGSQWLCVVWLALLVRLLLPWPLETPWGLLDRWQDRTATTALASPSEIKITYPRDNPATQKPSTQPATPLPANSGPTLSSGNLLTIAWLCGLTLSLALLARHQYQTSRLASQTLPARDERLLAIFRSIPRELRHRVELRTTTHLNVPTLTGVFQPQIWLPQPWLAEFTDDELRAILLHELGHAHRGDLAVQWLFAVAQCLHWFNPLVWLAARAARFDREMACDAWVLARDGGDASLAYGATLLKTVQFLRAPLCAPATTVTMASARENLRARIAGIGAFRPARIWPGLVAIAAMLASLTLLTTSAQTPSASPAQTPSPAPSGFPVATPSNPATGSAGKLRTPEIEIQAKFVEIQDDSAWKALCAKNPDLQKLAAKLESNDTVSAAPAGTPADGASAAALKAIAPGKWVLNQGAWETASNTKIAQPTLLTAGQLQQMLRSMDQAKGVNFLAAPRVTSKDGTHTIIEVTREFRYASEWKTDPDDPEGFIPAEFVTRNTGATLATTAHLLPDGRISLDLGPQLCSFLGFILEKDGVNTAAGFATVVPPGALERPVFSTSHLDVSTAVPQGQTVLLGGTRIDPVGNPLDPNNLGSLSGKDQVGAISAHSVLLVFVTAKAVLPVRDRVAVDVDITITPHGADAADHRVDRTSCTVWAGQPITIPADMHGSKFTFTATLPGSGTVDIRGVLTKPDGQNGPNGEKIASPEMKAKLGEVADLRLGDYDFETKATLDER